VNASAHSNSSSSDDKPDGLESRGRRELDVYCFLPVNVPSPSSPSEILPVIVFPLTVPV
jgi:hypothetical protein